MAQVSLRTTLGTIRLGGRARRLADHSREVAMYVIREVLNCKPGKVRPMVEKFRALSRAVEERGYEPLRLLTDVASEPFWTVVAEAKVERVDDFFVLEQELMSSGSLQEVMADYHDLVASGHREVYRIEGVPDGGGAA
jgi:hypothetical protein